MRDFLTDPKTKLFAGALNAISPGARYMGFYQSVNSFVCDKFVDNNDIPEYLFIHISIENLAEDVMKDYTAIEGYGNYGGSEDSEGVHIFQNKK